MLIYCLLVIFFLQLDKLQTFFLFPCAPTHSPLSKKGTRWINKLKSLWNKMKSWPHISRFTCICSFENVKQYKHGFWVRGRATKETNLTTRSFDCTPPMNNITCVLICHTRCSQMNAKVSNEYNFSNSEDYQFKWFYGYTMHKLG